MSDGRCQVQTVPVIKKRDRMKKEDKEKSVIVPDHPGSSTLTPVFSTTKQVVDNEPCVLPPEISQKLKDSKDLIIVNNSTEIDDELLEGREELIFTKIIDTPTSIKEIVNLSNKNVTNTISKLEMPIKSIGSGVLDSHENEYETSNENITEIQQNAEKERRKFRADLTDQRSIINIMDILRQNKRTDEPDSVSAETKTELNKYLEFGTKSAKVLDIIKFIKQNKKHDGVEKNNTPNININIFKMMKAVTDVGDNYPPKKKYGYKVVNDTIKTTVDLYSDSIEKKIERDNNKYNLDKTTSTETVETKKNKLDSASVERKIENNNKEYDLHNTKPKNNELNETNISEVESSEKQTKGNNTAKVSKIKLLETNVHSESDSIQEKYKESNTEQTKKIKYHESDSTEKLSGEMATDTFNVINENYKELSESDQISNHSISNHNKERDNSDDTSDNSDEIKIIPTDKNENKQTDGTTLKPKKKMKKDYTYMQGPHTLGGNYLSYEVKSNRRVVPSITARRKKNNINKVNNRRINNEPKNYWSVPFNILTRNRLETVTYS